LKRIIIPPYDSYYISTIVKTGNTYYIGHIGGSKDENGNILTNIEEQTDHTLQNMKKYLGEAGLCLNDVVKLTVILRNISDFAGMHSIWKQYFKKEHLPARVTITSDFVDDYCLIQIEGVAYKE
jgi:2-iminobutanoate/2-iminopropanoate deaminase